MGVCVFGNKENNEPCSSCNSTSDCPVGQYCDAGKCLCHEGSSCKNSSDCGGQSAICLNNVCKINTVPEISAMA